tara:strand:- start:203 stop:3241 length:3039 start_codon:yes stop_codon:yes gene_type:complete
MNMRIIAAIDGACKPVDFIAQRYNEFALSGIENSISSYQYNDFIHSSLRTNKSYLRTSNPFSPFSVDMSQVENLFKDGTFASSENKPIPTGLVMGDFPFSELLSSRKGKKLTFNQISFELPQQEDLTSLSFYAYVYQRPQVASNSGKNNQEFSINNISSLIATAVPLGLGYYFEPATTENPYVGMAKFTTRSAPDRAKLTVRDQTTGNDPMPLVVELLEKINQDTVDISENQYYYSDLWVSRDDKGRNRLACAFDIKAFLINNSIFPSLYKSQELCKTLLGDSSAASIVAPPEPSHIKTSMLLKRQMSPTSLAPGNALATSGHFITLGPSSTFSDIEIGPFTKVDGLSDAYSGIEFLESMDTDISIPGNFQYGIRLSVTDSSLVMMRTFASLFIRLGYSTSFIMNSVSSTLGPGAIKSILANLSGLDYLLGLLSSTTNIELEKYYTPRIYPGDTKKQLDTLSEINKIFSFIIEDIMDKLRKVAPDNPLGSSTTLGPKALAMGQNKMGQNLQQNSQYYFSEVLEISNNVGYGADYILEKNKTMSGIESVTIEDYLSRRKEEFIKYFQPIVGSNSSPPETGFFADASYSYMTPKTIRTPGRMIINQPSVKSERSAVSYDYNRYAQLFVDILSIDSQRKKGISSPAANAKPPVQTDENFIYNTALGILATDLGVLVKDVAVAQFKTSKVIVGSSKSTVTDSKEATDCPTTDASKIIPAIIGGSTSVQLATTSLVNSIDLQVLAQDKTQLAGYTGLQKARSAQKIGSIKLPFAILGELTLSPEIASGDSGYDSLVRLKNFLNVASDQVNSVLQKPFVSSLPNQIKSMIAFAASDERETLGVGSDNTQYSANRPVIQDPEASTEPDQMISYYGKQEKIPPYPKTLDPMRSYSKFLAFWMNYKQIGVVEYLDGFENVLDKPELPNLSGTQRRLKLPIWRRLDAVKGGELQTRSTKLLCRVRSMSSQDYVNLAGEEYSDKDKSELAEIFETKEILNLPSYNEYFYLEGTALQTAADGID